jgi:hypothetical protein
MIKDMKINSDLCTLITIYSPFTLPSNHVLQGPLTAAPVPLVLEDENGIWLQWFTCNGCLPQSTTWGNS